MPPSAVLSVACPICFGPLEVTRAEARCREGHVVQLDEILVEQTESLTRALWIAIHSLEDRARSAAFLAQLSTGGGSKSARSPGWDRTAGSDESTAAVLRQHVAELESLLAAGRPAGEAGADD